MFFVIFPCLSCSDPKAPLRNRAKLATDIKDYAGCIAICEMNMRGVRNTDPTVIQDYRTYSFRLKQAVTEAKNIGMTDVEINQLIYDGKSLGRRGIY